MKEAQSLLDAISARELPQIWEGLGTRRVLIEDLSCKQQTLVLLYVEVNGALAVEHLHDSTEYSNLQDYRKLLRRLHAERLVEFDEERQLVMISPKGIAKAEQLIASASN